MPPSIRIIFLSIFASLCIFLSPNYEEALAQAPAPMSCLCTDTVKTNPSTTRVNPCEPDVKSNECTQKNKKNAGGPCVNKLDDTCLPTDVYDRECRWFGNRTCSGPGTSTTGAGEIDSTTEGGGEAPTVPIKVPEFNIRLPGLEQLQPPTEVACGNNQRCLVIPWIGIYIGIIYQYALSIITLIAVAMIMIGGVMWLTAGGSSDRVTKAKEYISGAVVGLLIAIFSYTLLSTVNPALVRFEDIKVVYIAPQAEGIGSNSCNLDENNIVTLTDTAGLQSNGKQVTKQVLTKLQSAATAAKTNGSTIVVNSGIRTLEQQQKLYDCFLNRNSTTQACTAGCSSCNEAAKPTCSAPHTSGIAVDVTLTGANLNCGVVKEINNCRSQNIKTSAGCLATATACQDALYKIMTDAGFTGIQAEWWHFEAK